MRRTDLFDHSLAQHDEPFLHRHLFVVRSFGDRFVFENFLVFSFRRSLRREFLAAYQTSRRLERTFAGYPFSGEVPVAGSPLKALALPAGSGCAGGKAQFSRIGQPLRGSEREVFRVFFFFFFEEVSPDPEKERENL